MTWAEDRAPVGTDPSADPGAVSERLAAGCRPPSPFAYSTNAINPIRNYYLPPANPRLPGFHFTLNQDIAGIPAQVVMQYVSAIQMQVHSFGHHAAGNEDFRVERRVKG